MSDVHDIALSIKNLRMEYRNSLAVTFEGTVFVARPETILWIERLLASSTSLKVVYDLEGYPVIVRDLEELLKALTWRLNATCVKYLEDYAKLQMKLTEAYTDLPAVPEHEE
jgi:hypothetical protein